MHKEQSEKTEQMEILSIHIISTVFWSEHIKDSLYIYKKKNLVEKKWAEKNEHEINIRTPNEH